MFGRYARNLAIMMLATGVVLLTESTGFCQVGGGGAGTTDSSVPTGGIEIDANGVLTQKTFAGNPELLNKERMAAAKAALNKEVQATSDLRKISLTRLEKEVEALTKAGKPIPPEMLYLAGMTRITHVFYYPESKDIVIAGPAEPFFYNAQNRVVGMESGRPALQLKDLLVALRCFAPGDQSGKFISCSIDPTQEGLANFRNAYMQVQQSGKFRPGLENEVVSLFRESLGMQTITITGVPKKSRFARVMVEADYEMKMIGLGLKRPRAKGVKITSFMEKANPSSVAKNSLQRWFFQPDYDCVQVNDDMTAMELVGTGVKLVGEGESVGPGGQRNRGRKQDNASRAFCNTFTNSYERLAGQVPLWAELRNLIDMSVTAAFIQKTGMYEKAGWEMTTFGDESKIAVETLEAPTQVAPVANAKWKGKYFMSPIAGGVSIQPRVALNSDRVSKDKADEINEVKKSIKLSNLADGQWWWD